MLPKGNLRIQLDSQIFFGKRLLDGGKFLIVTALHGAFPFEVDYHGTLFRLKSVMVTYRHQTIDDVIERVVVVIEQHDVPLVAEDDLRKNIFLGQWFGTTHGELEGTILVS